RLVQQKAARNDRNDEQRGYRRGAETWHLLCKTKQSGIRHHALAAILTHSLIGTRAFARRRRAGGRCVARRMAAGVEHAATNGSRITTLLIEDWVETRRGRGSGCARAGYRQHAAVARWTPIGIRSGDAHHEHHRRHEWAFRN